MTDQTDTPLLSVASLSLERGGRLLFEGLSFTLKAGQGLCVRGPNGCGKSSLLRVLAGISHASDGVVTVKGVSAAQETRRYAAGLGYLGHKSAFKDSQSVEASLATWAALSDSAGVTDVLSAVGLSDQASFPVRTLSAGQRRRLQLARLLAKGAPLWIMDEPFTALDDAGRVLLLDQITRHRAGGGAVIAALHGADDIPGAGQLHLGVAS